MILDRLSKNSIELIRTSYRIDKEINIYYPNVNEECLYERPQEKDLIKYKPTNIIPNAFEGYCDEEKGISIMTFSVGHKLYIRPDFSFLFPNYFKSSSEQLEKMGLKPKKLNTPFSHGAMPADEAWNENYRLLKAAAEDFYYSFEREMSAYDDLDDFLC